MSDDGPVGVMKKGEKERNFYKFCMLGRIREIVIYFKFHENRSRGIGAVEGQNRPLPLTCCMAYTKA